MKDFHTADKNNMAHRELFRIILLSVIEGLLVIWFGLASLSEVLLISGNFIDGFGTLFGSFYLI